MSIFEIEPAFQLTAIPKGHLEISSKFELAKNGLPPFLHTGTLPKQDFWNPPRSVAPFGGAEYSWRGMVWQLGSQLSPNHGRGPVRVDPNELGASNIPDAYWIGLPIDGLILYVSECQLRQRAVELTAEAVRRYLWDRYAKAREKYSGRQGYPVMPEPVLVAPIIENTGSPELAIALLLGAGACLSVLTPGLPDEAFLAPTIAKLMELLSGTSAIPLRP
ncbi:hypothetical protein ANRL4_03370 [Anaerolineae bacterium]|nr:hypothetical protein ANRL4_03370 [Anaerolineae bacterium]